MRRLLISWVVLVGLGCECDLFCQNSCHDYCAEAPAAEIQASCQNVFGVEYGAITQCPTAPAGCYELPTIAPATCADGSEDRIYCCPVGAQASERKH